MVILGRDATSSGTTQWRAGSRRGARGGSARHEMTHHRLRPTEVDEAARSQPRGPKTGRERRPAASMQLRVDAHALHPLPLIGQTQMEISAFETRVHMMVGTMFP